MPQFLSSARVDRPQVIGLRDVDDAVRNNRRSLQGLAGLEFPDLLQMADVLRSDLGQLAMALSVVLAVIGEPCVRRWMEERFGVHALRAERHAGETERRNWGKSTEEAHLFQGLQIGV